jgi:hypothetical protein
MVEPRAEANGVNERGTGLSRRVQGRAEAGIPTGGKGIRVLTAVATGQEDRFDLSGTHVRCHRLRHAAVGGS